MLVTKVTCPHCDKRLKISRPLAVGERVYCSGCKRSFALRAEPEVRAELSPAPPAPPPAQGQGITFGQGPVMPPPVDVDAEDEPRPVPPWLAVLGLAVLVGGLLLLAGGIALTIHLSAMKAQARARAEEAAAAATAARTAGPEAPPGDAGPVELPLEPRRDTPPDDLAPRAPAPDKPPVRPGDAPPLGPGPGAPAGPGWLPPAEQKRVNDAIDKGLEYLKGKQRPDGTWSDFHPVGLTALPGLTLLECGVPRDDPRVQAAAAYVRSAVPKLDRTYELSLCILFLDRLGEPGDRPLIQAMALRLIAGQSLTGGWAYTCPVLEPLEERQLMLALQKTKPASNLDLFLPAPGERPPPELFVPGKGGKSPDLAVPGRKPGGPDANREEAKPGVAFPGELPVPPEKKPAKPPQPAESLARVHALLPPRLKNVAALTPSALAGPFPPHGPVQTTDNSNTQFAILGLWAAGRHEVPMERSLALLVRRFRSSQTRDGGWGYSYQPGSHAQSPSMTGAGLLGLAVGHGLVRSGDNPVRGAIRDPEIERGFRYLARHIGGQLGGDINLYFLWTLERVGVLYSQRTIDKKDWYAWGARRLLERQGKEGEWGVGGYHGSQPLMDTCFALLFLKRANLTHDLSRKLEFFVEGKAEQPTPPLRDQK
jgi:hypothetical protein